MKKIPLTIAIAKGDGIGPEVIEEALKILHIIEENTDYSFQYYDTPVGGQVWKETGSNLPEKSLEAMQKSRAILLGATGLPGLPLGTAESAILKIRQNFNQYVNLRPVKLLEAIRDKCPLKDEYIQNGIDIHIIRENTESLYAKIGGILHEDCAINNMIYTRKGVERIVRYAFEYATRLRHHEIINVDKANLLECSQFWRSIFTHIGGDYPQIEKKHFYVDAFCQWLIRQPSSIHTVVTENMFGDIISDEAAYLVGSLGMGASGNINPEGISMYEPIHGSAPDIAGQGIANPIGAILSVKLMFEESFHDPNIGQAIENAVSRSLFLGRTVDLISEKYKAHKHPNTLSTAEMGSLIATELHNELKQ